MKRASLTSGEAYISHCRDKDQIEVDFVLERGRQVVGIQAKAAATAKPQEFRGLRRLKDATGNTFVCGIVLRDGERIQKVAEGLYAMPIQELWVTSPRR